MPRAWIRPALSALVIFAVAAPALAHEPPPPGGGCRQIRGEDTPEDPADDVSVCREDVWFHKGTAQVGNLAGFGQSTLPSWNTTKPTAELHDAGVYVSSSEHDIFVQEGGPAGRAQFEGKFTGPLDTLGFRLFARSPFDEVWTGNALPATVHLAIDGEVVYDNYTTAAIELPLQGDETLLHIDGAFHKLYDHMASLGLDMSATKEHTINFGVVGWFFPGSETVFVYDADEAQSGLYFNLEPGSMAGFTKIDPTV